MYLTQYMQAFFQLTFKAIREDEATVKLQAMEVWTTVAEQEFELIEISTSQAKPPARDLVDERDVVVSRDLCLLVLLQPRLRSR